MILRRQGKGWIESTTMLIAGRSGQFRIMVRGRGQQGIKPKIVLTYYRLVNTVFVPRNSAKCYVDLVWHRDGVFMEKEGLIMAEEGKFSLRDLGRS